MAREASPESPPEAPVLPPSVVGRQRELERLDERLVQVLRGERRVVFITGESGIGKTTLVDAFLAGRAGQARLWVARGQSIEHLGAGEAYMPVLDALAHLCREPGARPIVDLLARYAPSWLAQMPAVLGPADFDAAGQGRPGPTRDRMLREIADAVEAITRQRPLVLVLEDLH